MRLSSSLVRAAGATLDLIAPPHCLACGTEDVVRLGLGSACLRLVRQVPPDPCPVCAAALGYGAPTSACIPCARLAPRFRASVAGAAYAGLGGELVRRAKYGRDALLGVPLAGLLADAVSTWEPGARADEVVCVPSTQRRRRERGFNLAELLADPIARRLGVPLRPHRLARVGEPAPQAALTRAERRRAATGTVRMRRRSRLARFLARRDAGVCGSRILLVDDVLTTGATANACARALLEAGARDVVVAVATRA